MSGLPALLQTGTSSGDTFVARTGKSRRWGATILPRRHGFLKLQERIQLSRAIGADDRLAEEAGSTGIGSDADYDAGGGDSLIYQVPISQLAKRPATVKATIYYQATPPYFLQDRFCTSNSIDTQWLFYMTGQLSLNDTPAQDWKLRLVDSGSVSIT